MHGMRNVWNRSVLIGSGFCLLVGANCAVQPFAVSSKHESKRCNVQSAVVADQHVIGKFFKKKVCVVCV